MSDLTDAPNVEIPGVQTWRRSKCARVNSPTTSIIFSLPARYLFFLSCCRFRVRTIQGAFNRLTYELIINGVKEEDYGTYECRIRNAQGSSSGSVQLRRESPCVCVCVCVCVVHLSHVHVGVRATLSCPFARKFVLHAREPAKFLGMLSLFNTHFDFASPHFPGSNGARPSQKLGIIIKGDACAVSRSSVAITLSLIAAWVLHR